MCTDPWDMRSYSDSSDGNTEREIWTIFWCPCGQNMLLCWVREHLASGPWMTNVSRGMFQGKEWRILSLDFRLCNTMRRIGNLFTSTMDVWCCSVVLLSSCSWRKSWGENTTDPDERRKVGVWWFRQGHRITRTQERSCLASCHAWFLSTKVSSRFLIPSNVLSSFHQLKAC